MSRLKLKQILSNLHYDAGRDQLIISGSQIPTGDELWNTTQYLWNQAIGAFNGPFPAFVISGSTEIASTPYQTGSLTIAGVDTFGDSGSFFTMDLGEF